MGPTRRLGAREERWKREGRGEGRVCVCVCYLLLTGEGGGTRSCGGLLSAANDTLFFVPDL